MHFSKSRNTSRWIIICASFLIISLILWNTYTFFQIFKQEERLKMNLWANAQKTLINAGENTDLELPLQIFSNNTSIPIMLTENDSIINYINIEEEIVKNPKRANQFLSGLKSENDPIVIEYVPGKFQYLYYGDSALLNKLKYYPVALLLIIVLFAALVYNFYKSTKMATQNKLWAGMAKETAHQIGTPLTSLVGWVEILKAENIDETTTQEIEKDIERLQTITERFSNIGSEPKLENTDRKIWRMSRRKTNGEWNTQNTTMNVCKKDVKTVIMCASNKTYATKITENIDHRSSSERNMAQPTN